MTMTKLFTRAFFAFAMIFVGTQAAVSAEPIDDKPSTYSPAADLQRYVGVMVKEIEKDLSEESEYNVPRIKRVLRQANTIAAAAMVLGKHDDSNELKAASGSVMKSSLALAKSVNDYGSAKSALKPLKQAIETSAESLEPKWGMVGDVEQLMLQVPVLTRKLRRCIGSTRFADSRDEAAALSATLAAVAQVSMFDRTYCKNRTDIADWETLCRRMRNVAAQYNVAVHAGDRLAAKDAVKELSRTCTDCHEQFRP